MLALIISVAVSSSADNLSRALDTFSTRFESLATRAEQHAAILGLLEELAPVLSTALTSVEVEFEVGSHLHKVLSAIDARDRELKRRFRELRNGIESTRKAIADMVNRTRQELQVEMDRIRDETVYQLRQVVTRTTERNKEVSKRIRYSVSDTAETYRRASTQEAVWYFVGLQVLLAATFYLGRRCQTVTQGA